MPERRGEPGKANPTEARGIVAQQRLVSTGPQAAGQGYLQIPSG